MARPKYLRPYLDAAKIHGGGFPALLWSSRETQLSRFDAFTRMYDFSGRSVLDVGCGRADLLDHLHARGQVPAEYVGIEMVPAFVTAAELSGASILRRDFIADPVCMFTGSDVVVFCGSLNTAEDDAFFATLKRAYDAAADSLLFNFLSSPRLAGAEHLYWRKVETVSRYCRNVLGTAPTILEDYMDGDASMLLGKPRR